MTQGDIVLGVVFGLIDVGDMMKRALWKLSPSMTSFGLIYCRSKIFAVLRPSAFQQISCPA